MHIASLLLAFLFVISSSAAQEHQGPPKQFVDTGACPFECCNYGKWRSLEPINLYASISPGAKVVAKVVENEVVHALTGDVHTIPGKYKLSQPFQHDSVFKHSHQAGEILFVYTYCGEGIYKIWCNNGMQAVDISNGTWIAKPTSIWWVKIKTKSGVVGWTKQADQFEGKDDCDQPLTPIQ